MAPGSNRRAACLLVRHWRACGYVRRRPELKERPFVVVASLRERARILATSPAAYERGVRRGQTLSQALALCSELEAVAADRRIDEENERILVRTARALTPRVEPAGEGVLFADPSGLERIHGSEEGFCRRLLEAAREAGFERVSASVADSRFASYAVAAVLGNGFRVVAPGRTCEVLAPLPLSLLPLEEETLEKLQALGIHTLGAFASLPAASVALRYGRSGLVAHRLARGGDEDTVAAEPEPEIVEHALTLSPPVSDTPTLLPAVERAIAKILERIEPSGTAALLLTLSLDDGSAVEIPLHTAEPTRDRSLLLEAARWDLERRSLGAPVSGLGVRVLVAQPIERGQGLLFEAPKRRNTGRVRRTLERLRRSLNGGGIHRVCEEAAGRPEERNRWLPYVPEKAGRTAGAPPARPEPPPSAVRLVDPPLPLRVWTKRGTPCALALPGRPRRRILLAFGPYRRSGEWWSRPFARDYYEVTDAEQGIYRIFRDGRDKGWYLHAIVD